jgi:hypothetical protein
MRNGISAALIGLIVSSVLADAAAIKVTVPQLLATPTRYNGRQVDVVGFYQGSYEDSSLYASARSAAHLQDDPKSELKTIWIEANIYDKRFGNPPQSPKSPEYHFAGRVRVIGTFRYRPRNPHRFPQEYSHLGLWPCALFDVTYFRALK